MPLPYAPKITILDIEIRAAVMRRMFPNSAQLTAERRKEIFAAYVASESADAGAMLRATRAAHDLGKLSNNQRREIFGSK